MVDRFGQAYSNVGLFIFTVAIKGTEGKVFQFEAKSKGKLGGLNLNCLLHNLSRVGPLYQSFFTVTLRALQNNYYTT